MGRGAPAADITASFSNMTLTTRAQAQRTARQDQSSMNIGKSSPTRYDPQDVDVTDDPRAPSSEFDQEEPQEEEEEQGASVEPDTEQQAAGHGEDSGSTDSSEGGEVTKEEEGNDDGSDSDGETMIWSSNTHFPYDIKTLPPYSRDQITEGLSSEMEVLYFTPSEGSRGQLLAFEINEPSCYQISIPLTYDQAPKCTCAENRDGIACRHVYWLEDQLLAATQKDSPTIPITPTIAGDRINDLVPSELLASFKGPRSLASDRDWILMPPGQQPPAIDETDVIEMLAVFEPNGLLSTENIAQPPYPVSPSRQNHSKKYEEVGKLIAKRVKKDVPLACGLQTIVTSPFQATVFFEKIHARAQKAFDLLDEHVEVGPTASGGLYDVIRTAGILEELEKKIDRWYEKHISQTPDSDLQETAALAVRVLIEMLYGVTSRDSNIYSGAVWAQNILALQNEADSNLYTRLIRQRDSNESESFFVIDTLQHIQQTADVRVFRQHQERLRSLEKFIKERGAPVEYLRTLSSIIQAISRKRSAVEEAGGSSFRVRGE